MRYTKSDSEWGPVATFGASLVLCCTAGSQTTSRVSIGVTGEQANGFSWDGVPSADGRFVAFESWSTNLYPGLGGPQEILVRDQLTGDLRWPSKSLAGHSTFQWSDNCSISADGRFVAFDSWSDQVAPGDANGVRDVLVWDRQADAAELVSLDSSGLQGNQPSADPWISADGRYVAFISADTNLVPGDSNGFEDVFVRDRLTGMTEIISISTAGVQSNADNHFNPVLSSDGRYVVFDSPASNLVPSDVNGKRDVFLRDRLLGTTELVSLSTAGMQGNDLSESPSISADGRFVAFHSPASNFFPSDANGYSDVFLRDRQSGTTELVSRDSAGNPGVGLAPSISGDGRLVAFVTGFPLVPGDANLVLDIYLYDLTTGVTELVSVSSSGTAGNANSAGAYLSSDGMLIAFTSAATTLVPGDTNGKEDVFIRDRHPSILPFCEGGSGPATCPCANVGAPGHGCENSAGTGGALTSGAGAASLAADSVILTTTGELPSALSIVLQGTFSISPVAFGDGLRCVGGPLKRLYVLNAVGGVVQVPPPGGPPLSARAAQLGDQIPPGASRVYQTYYRDPQIAFCPAPAGNTWNVSSGLRIVWDY